MTTLNFLGMRNEIKEASHRLFLSQPPFPMNHCYMNTCICTYPYIFLNTICSVCIMLLVRMFTGMAILYWTNWCALLWGILFLLFLAFLSYLWFLVEGWGHVVGRLFLSSLVCLTVVLVQFMFCQSCHVCETFQAFLFGKYLCNKGNSLSGVQYNVIFFQLFAFELYITHILYIILIIHCVMYVNFCLLILA